MSSRGVIWVRDALVITLSIYVVFSIALAPWNNLDFEETLPVTCETGCAPVINYPDDGYYHYKDSIVFEWKPVSVEYRFTVLNSTGHIFHDENLTGVTTSTTNRLPAGDYSSFVYYKGIAGSFFGDDEPLLRNEEHSLSSSSKVILVWSPVEITYGIEIREHKATEIPIVHHGEGLTQTSYEFEDFVSESSNERELNIDTTKFLAYELCNNWEVPFILLGILMVVALQAGVFLAREETND